MARARIFRPAKTAMQSGRAQTRKWVLEYEPATPRQPDPLMGWASAADTLNEVQLRFDTRDEAVAFADRSGLDYTVIAPHEQRREAEELCRQFPLRPGSQLSDRRIAVRRDAIRRCRARRPRSSAG